MSSWLEEGLSVICPSQLNLPEGVAIDADDVVWAGGADGEVYRIAGDLFVPVHVKLSGRLLGITAAPGGGLVVCASGEHKVYRIGKDREVTDIGPDDLVMPNFAAFDGDGRLYVTDSGSMESRNGRLIRIDPDGSHKVIADGLAFANGLAFTQDFGQLYLAQSGDKDVLVLDIDGNGDVTGCRVAVSRERIGREIGGDTLTDGIALDEAGNLYIALPRIDKVVVVTPQDELFVVAADDGPAKGTDVVDYGQVLRSPTNIAFGGDDRRDLYIANLRTRHLARGRVRVPGLALPGQVR
jgi:gluconolactonase